MVKSLIGKMYHSNIFLFSISIILFGIGYYTHDVNSVILYMLEFTVVFELVRTFNHYLKDGQIKVRYGIDAAIFYTIKELYIGFVGFKLDHDNSLVILSLAALSVLMALRYVNSTLVEEKRKICNHTEKCPLEN